MRQSYRALSGKITLQPFALPLFDAGFGVNRSAAGGVSSCVFCFINSLERRHPLQWLIQTGPSAEDLENPEPPEYCVIIKPIIVRKRVKLWRLKTTPLSIFNPNTENQLEYTGEIRFSSRVMVLNPFVDVLRDTYPCFQCAGNVLERKWHESSWCDSERTSGYDMFIRRRLTICSQRLATDCINFDVESEEDNDSDQSGGLSLVEDRDPPSDFETLLDTALLKFPALSAVVADWEVFETFIRVCISADINGARSLRICCQVHDGRSAFDADELAFDLEEFETANGQACPSFGTLFIETQQVCLHRFGPFRLLQRQRPKTGVKQFFQPPMTMHTTCAAT